jgi:hypothetical protein
MFTLPMLLPTAVLGWLLPTAALPLPQDQLLPEGWWKLPALALSGIFLLVFLFVFLRYANLYVQSVLAKAGVGPSTCSR